jgi:hypothetical protein
MARYKLAKRKCLSYSPGLSIHKAQRQTLERVKVDLGKFFEKGQAYVALSKATSMKGLEILNFAAIGTWILISNWVDEQRRLPHPIFIPCLSCLPHSSRSCLRPVKLPSVLRHHLAR